MEPYLRGIRVVRRPNPGPRVPRDPASIRRHGKLRNDHSNLQQLVFEPQFVSRISLPLTSLVAITASDLSIFNETPFNQVNSILAQPAKDQARHFAWMHVAEERLVNSRSELRKSANVRYPIRINIHARQNHLGVRRMFIELRPGLL